MARGTMEVLLVNAKGLENTDFLNNMDPYVILTFKSQEQKSSIASGQGSEPEWNETFVFTVSEGSTDLSIKILDSDTATNDDFVGEATISLEALFSEGSVPPTVYNVVSGDEYKGEIKIGLTFTPEEVNERECEHAEESQVDGRNLLYKLSAKNAKSRNSKSYKSY